MPKASKSFEDTITMRTRIASQSRGVGILFALGRMTQPLVLFPVIAFVILAILWAGTLNFIRAEDVDAQRAAVASTRESLATYDAQVVRAIGDIDQTLKFMQYAAETRGDQLALAELQARGLLPPNLLFIVTLTDAHGGVVATTGALQVKNTVDPAYLAAVRDSPSVGRGFWVDHPRRDPLSGEWRLQFSRRLNARDGSFAGIVTVAVDAAYFVSGYDAAKLGEHGMLGMLGTDGTFLVRRTGDTVSAGDTVDYRLVVSPGKDEDDAAVSIVLNFWDGVRRYTSTRELFEFPLAVIVGLSESEQLATASSDRRSYLRDAAIASAVIVVLAAILSRLSWQLLQERRRASATEIEHAARVQYLAYHDGLTGLPNRSLFGKILARDIKLAQRHPRRLAVLFLDLDRFKQINDTLGHEAGDRLLQEVARRLSSSLRESDTVARLGGDEFVVLLPEMESAEYVAHVAQKILSSLAEPFLLLGHDFRITASIGIGLFPEHGEDEQTLTKHADVAMYQAKEEGKNNYQFYSDELNANSLERLAFESSLRQALERHEFQLFYQAKRDIMSGQITGMEALLRWRHPALGVLAPMQFIPVAEETGLIVPIGKWVLKTACMQATAWREQGLENPGMAVNLSSRQFFDEHLLLDIAAILQETGLPAQFLELEITESLFIHDVPRTLRIMTGLKALGVKLAVNDFGTSYSSLASLRQFRIDTIKIDRSLIRDISAAATSTAGGAAQSLADAIIAMGRSLSMTVVAQGVESNDQADYLRLHGCDEVQGFYFNKPLSAEQATQLLQSQGSHRPQAFAPTSALSS